MNARPLTEADLAGIDRVDPPADGGWGVRAWSRALAHPVDHSFALVDGAALRGVCAAQRVIDEVELHRIAIAPSQRGRGLGSRLLAHALQAWAAAGAPIVHLEVAIDNAPARALYSRFDFEVVGRRSGYYARRDGELVDALLLTRRR